MPCATKLWDSKMAGNGPPHRLPPTSCLLSSVSYSDAKTQKYDNHKASFRLRRPDKQDSQTPVLPNYRTPSAYEDRQQETQDFRVTLYGHKWPFAGEGQRSQPCLQDVVYKESHLLRKSMFSVKFNLEKATYLHVWAPKFKMLTFICNSLLSGWDGAFCTYFSVEFCRTFLWTTESHRGYIYTYHISFEPSNLIGLGDFLVQSLPTKI